MLYPNSVICIYSCGCIAYERWEHTCEFRFIHRRLPNLVFLIAKISSNNFGAIKIESSGFNDLFTL